MQTGHLLAAHPRAGQHALDGHALDDLDPQIAGPPGEGHRQVDGIDAAVAGDIETGKQVIGLGEGEELAHLPGPDLVDLEAEAALEGGDAPVFLEPVGVGGGLDQPDRLEPGRDTCLGLQARVKVTAIEADAGGGLARASEGRHQPGGMPGRATGEPVALE